MNGMPTATKTYRFGEFFSGPGGMSLGAKSAEVLFGDGGTHRAVLEPVWAVDRDLDSCRTYAHNIHGPGTRVYQASSKVRPGIERAMSPIETAVINAGVDEINPALLNPVDLFLFGFPCNDFSIAGRRLGLDGEYGGLYTHAVRYIEAHEPMLFVAENVTGIMHANDYRAFFEIMDALRMGGKYRVVPHLYRFEKYGIPQTRHRVILVGMHAEKTDFDGKVRHFLPPAPTTEDRPVSALEALEEAGLDEPTSLGAKGSHVSAFKNHVHKKVSPEVTERLKLTPEGKNVWDVNDELPDHLKLAVNATFISTIYKVLDRTKPAYTVVGNGGGGTHMYHWDRRPTTDRERAVFQTFPTDFEFLGSVTSIRKQIGMAVPPKGAAQIIEAVLKTIHDVEYDCVESNVREKDASEVEAAERRRSAVAADSAEVGFDTPEQQERKRHLLDVRARRAEARRKIVAARADVADTAPNDVPSDTPGPEVRVSVPDPALQACLQAA